MKDFVWKFFFILFFLAPKNGDGRERQAPLVYYTFITHGVIHYSASPEEYND